ncbi:MAG TPA: PLP-dependent aminotransferase family protein [Thermodesulfovibrionales bacterium]|nr:PLP-dependent aminotransferase family protein [Thermodesulfovibrionales bacterium]
MTYAKRISGLKSSAIREILKITERPGIISFAGGLPAPELFPLKEVATAVQRLFSKYGPSVLQYSLTEGLGRLREKISRMLDPNTGRIGVGNIIITQGSQQGLDLVAKLYLDEGDVVFTENPSYLGALQSFRLFQAEVRPVPSDENGIRTDSLIKALQDERPAFIYLMPNFQNPTGISLSLERRRQLVEIVKERDLVVVEDDPYGALRFSGEKLPSLFELGGAGNFIYLSSFSKTIAPGLRVAYVAAEEEVIGKLAVLKQGTDLQTNTLGQYLVSEYLESGDYREHIGLLRKTYAYRRDCMLSAMERHFPETVTWNRPEGGMFLWVKLPDGSDAAELLPRCLERNVAFVPGREFFPDGSGENTIRLNFSNADPENIEEGIGRMGEVMKPMSG